MKKKIMQSEPSIVARVIIPQNGRMEFEDGWLIQPSVITMDSCHVLLVTKTSYEVHVPSTLSMLSFLFYNGNSYLEQC